LHRSYHYSRPYATTVACLLIVLPVLIFLLMALNIGLGKNLEENILLLLLYLPVVTMVIAPLLWLVNTLSVRVRIDNDLIDIRSLTRRTTLRWSDIAAVNKRAYFSGSFPSYGPPRDLEIITTRKKRIKIFFFIRSVDAEDGEESIEEVETAIRSKIAGENYPADPD
jgi:hypothetical protein